MVVDIPVRRLAQAADTPLQPGVNRDFFRLLVLLHELLKGQAQPTTSLAES